MTKVLKLSPTANPVAQKLSVSLFEADLERVDAIADFMKAKAGVRLNTSQAIKLALRAVAVDGGLLKVWEKILADDGRRRTADALKPRKHRKAFEVSQKDKDLCRGLLNRLPKSP